MTGKCTDFFKWPNSAQQKEIAHVTLNSNIDSYIFIHDSLELGSYFSPNFCAVSGFGTKSVPIRNKNLLSKAAANCFANFIRLWKISHHKMVTFCPKFWYHVQLIAKWTDITSPVSFEAIEIHESQNQSGNYRNRNKLIDNAKHIV